MGSSYAPQRTTYDTGDRRWLPDLLAAETHGVSLNGDLFSAGVVKSGTDIGIVTATKLAGPYDPAATDGRQKADGHLLNDQKVEAGGRYHVAAVHAGTVKRDLLPAGSGHDAAAEADLTTIAYR